MPAERIDIAERIADHFPLGRAPLTLEVVPGATGEWLSKARADQPAAVATVRMIVWEYDAARDSNSVRDIKEQELDMGWPALYDDEPRVAAFFRALGDAITQLGERALDEAECMMPIDLMRTDVLALRKATTSDEFLAALMTKSRFGRMLGR